MAKMSVDDKLGLDLFHTDEHNPHITVNEDYDDMEEIRKVLLAYDDMEEIRKVLLACPAGLYHYENGKVTFSHEGCLECGTCRVLSIDKVVKSWDHPMGGAGVQFRQG